MKFLIFCKPAKQQIATITGCWAKVPYEITCPNCGPNPDRQSKQWKLTHVRGINTHQERRYYMRFKHFFLTQHSVLLEKVEKLGYEMREGCS